MRHLDTLWQALRRGRRARAWRLVDFWAGDTITDARGQRWFRMPDGSLKPAISGGGAQGWEELIETITADGTAVASTTETSVAPDFNIPAYYMAPGRVLRLWASGINSNVVTTPGTQTLRVRWGTNSTPASNTALLQSSALDLDITARTGALWFLHAYVVCRVAGAGTSGKFLSSGFSAFTNQKVAAVLSGNTDFSTMIDLLGSAGTPIASGNAEVGVNTTVANLLQISATQTVATASLTCQSRLVEVLN